MEKVKKKIPIKQAALRLILPFALIVGLIVLDAVVKILIRSNVTYGESLQVIPNFFYITYIENPGAALGFLSGNTTFFLIINFIAMPAVMGVIIWQYKAHKMFLSSLACIVAGGLGNCVDRLAYDGKVTDMFEIRYFGGELFGSESFPIFNVADVCLTVGVVLILCYFLFVYYDKKDPQAVAKHDRKLREKAEKKAAKRSEKDAKNVVSVEAWLALQQKGESDTDATAQTTIVKESDRVMSGTRGSNDPTKETITGDPNQDKMQTSETTKDVSVDGTEKKKQ